MGRVSLRLSGRDPHHVEDNHSGGKAGAAVASWPSLNPNL